MSVCPSLSARFCPCPATLILVPGVLLRRTRNYREGHTAGWLMDSYQNEDRARVVSSHIVSGGIFDAADWSAVSFHLRVVMRFVKGALNEFCIPRGTVCPPRVILFSIRLGSLFARGSGRCRLYNNSCWGDSSGWSSRRGSVG